jgi:transposase
MSKRKRQSHRRAKAARSAGKSTAALDPQVNSDASDIDVGAEELVAAVPPGRGATGAHLQCLYRRNPRPARLAAGVQDSHRSDGKHRQLLLTACAVLEDAGIEVCLVNARHVKGVPGKKSDVCDAAWLQQLHAAGLLRASFRPRREIIPLRYLIRHRADLVAQAGQQVQLMQKVMTEMNLHIDHVFSDVDGASAQAIISAILAGERDPPKNSPPCATGAAVLRWPRSSAPCVAITAKNISSFCASARRAGRNSARQ